MKNYKYAVLVMASDMASYEIISTIIKDGWVNSAIIKDPYTGFEKKIRRLKKKGFRDEFGGKYYLSETHKEYTDINY